MIYSNHQETELSLKNTNQNRIIFTTSKETSWHITHKYYNTSPLICQENCIVFTEVIKMKTISFNSYIGLIRNPFQTYFIDLSGLGILEIEEGVFTSRGIAYDLFPISNASYKATIIQRIFGLGNISLTIKENDVTKTINICNVRNAKYITGVLRNHHQNIMKYYFEETHLIHYI